ncbi:MAG: hypothetical protein HY363_04540 [Candidatus Aenigmarchaeota archaeon]|nr:hypothetical protein [Candidatus Aenigmarchaeota archaeon]
MNAIDGTTLSKINRTGAKSRVPSKPIKNAKQVNHDKPKHCSKLHVL